jgi:CRISPR/Cas system-associated protein endoribonuclease Cas2
MVFGFKMSTQKAALEAEIDRVKKRLPPAVAIAGFNVGDKPFTSWTFVAGNIIPADKQALLKAFLEANIPDKAAADDHFQALLARKFRWDRTIRT